MFVIRVATLSVTQIIHRRMMGLLMNNNLESMWRKRWEPSLRRYEGIWLTGLKKKHEQTVRTADVRAES